MVKILKAALVVLLVMSGFLPEIRGQSLTPSVIASGGGYFASAGASLSFTIGETAITTGLTASVMLTQGFQQPGETTVGVEESSADGKTVMYPNPNNGTFTLTTGGLVVGEATVKVYSLLGQVVYSATAIGAASGAGATAFHLQLPVLSDGIYGLELLPAGSESGSRHILTILH